MGSWLAGTFRPAGLPLNPGAVVPYREPMPRTLDPRIRRMHTDTGLDCRGSGPVRSSPAADGEQKIAARRRGLKSRLPTIFRAEIPRSSFTFAPCRRCVGQPHQPPPGLSQHKSYGPGLPRPRNPALAHNSAQLRFFRQRQLLGGFWFACLLKIYRDATEARFSPGKASLAQI